MDLRITGIETGGYLFLSRGSKFDVNVTFDYKGKPQTLTFELKMKHGALGTEYLCGSPTSPVEGALDWTGNTGKLSYTVPSGVQDGAQDIRMHILTQDGKEEYSDWLTDCIFIS